MQANMGMAGEFRCVVKRADGSTKIDTGYQKNLILNQGLDFFGGGNGSDMMAYCVIGSGNSQPSYTQNKLDTAVLGTSGTEFSTKYDYDSSTEGNLYKTNRVKKYSFTGLNNVNISELGLASTYNSATSYFLCTRALIKDSNGNPTTITVLSGEQLDIYYKLWIVYDVKDKTGTLNLLDGAGGSTAYNYIARLAGVGSENIAGNAKYGKNCVGFALSAGIYNKTFDVNNGDIGAITGAPNGTLSESIPSLYLSTASYIPGSYKRLITCAPDVNFANLAIRSAIFYTTMGFWQIRFGSVANDSPITKTNTQTLSIPIEVSWGRYEGAL
jgi:hypothetical protein